MRDVTDTARARLDCPSTPPSALGRRGIPAASARAEENRGDRATRFDVSTEDLGQGRVARWKASRPGRRAHDAREGISRP
jgi:hypothetical protein